MYGIMVRKLVYGMMVNQLLIANPRFGVRMHLSDIPVDLKGFLPSRMSALITRRSKTIFRRCQLYKNIFFTKMRF